MAWRSLMYLLWSHAIASTMTCNRTAHLKDHYAMYHRHGEVLLDYGDGTCPLTYDDLAYGYETMLMDPKNNNQYFRFFGIVSQRCGCARRCSPSRTACDGVATAAPFRALHLRPPRRRRPSISSGRGLAAA